MCLVSLITVLASTVQVHPGEQQVNRTAEPQTSMQDQFDNWVRRTTDAAPFLCTELDCATLSKSHQSRLLAHRGLATKPYLTSIPAVRTRGSRQLPPPRASRTSLPYYSFKVQHPSDGPDCKVGGSQLCGCSELLRSQCIRSINDCTQRSAVAACVSGKCRHEADSV
jgi:hypothetical protein